MSLSSKLRQRIRQDVQSMQAYAIQHSVGMVKLDAHVIEVTPMGWYLVRAIAMVFDKYVQADGQRAHFSKIL